MKRPRLLPWRDWPLRARLAALVLSASLVPLAVSTAIDIREAAGRLTRSAQDLLTARGDQIAREIDSTHLGYQRSTERLARQPATSQYCKGDSAGRAALQDRMSGILGAFPASDADIRGATLIDLDGSIAIATEPALVGTHFGKRKAVRSALAGDTVISGVYISNSATGHRPTVSYLVPVRDADAKVVCAVGLLVHADVFWRQLKAANGLAGPGSFGVMFDSNGIRIAHSSDSALVYTPAGPLPPALVEAYAAEGRFGPRTRDLLQDVRPFPQQFERAVSTAPDAAVFRGFGPVNQQWNLGVGRRLAMVPWTIFYMTPEANIATEVAAVTRKRVVLAFVIMTAAALAAVLFASSILQPVRSLAAATARLAAGDEGARVAIRGSDEFAQLGEGFNTMAERLQAQARTLRDSHAQLEQRVRERTGLLYAIIDNSPAVISVKDLEGRFLLVNERFCGLYGVRKDEVLGHSSHEFLDPATADAFTHLDARAVAAGGSVTDEQELHLPGGTRTFLTVKCPLHDDAGRVYGVAGVSTDITERKHAESRRAAELERLNLLDQITIAIAERRDLHSIHQVVLASLEERLPVDFCFIARREPVSRRLEASELGPMSRGLFGTSGVEAIAIASDALSACAAGQLVYEPDLRASGLPLPPAIAELGMGSLAIAPLMTQDRLDGILVAARRAPDAFTSSDCEFLRQLSGHVSLASEQARLHEVLRAAYEDLRHSQQAVMEQERLRALGQMASGIAHDINNAISPVAIYAEALLEHEPGLSPQARGQLEIIARAIDDVAETVARMREFYRQGGEAGAALAPTDLGEIVPQVVGLTRARWSDMAQARGVTVEMRTELDAQLPRVMAVESEVREALTNLVFNAVDAMPGGGTLTIRTCAGEHGSVLLEVTDTGTGMDEATRQRCLEPFFTTKGERGTGLGLAMVYGIAQRHDARLEIDSEPGRGTTVRLAFPAARGGIDGPVALPGAAAPPRMKLLVVDDDPVLLRSLTETLGAEGHAVTAAQGGQAGIDAFGRALAGGEGFDAVITDLGMAVVDGRQMAATVKAASPATPVVMLTGWGRRLLAEQDIPPHVDALLGKPPRQSELREVLARCAAKEAAHA